MNLALVEADIAQTAPVDGALVECQQSFLIINHEHRERPVRMMGEKRIRENPGKGEIVARDDSAGVEHGCGLLRGMPALACADFLDDAVAFSDLPLERLDDPVTLRDLPVEPLDDPVA